MGREDSANPEDGPVRPVKHTRSVRVSQTGPDRLDAARGIPLPSGASIRSIRKIRGCHWLFLGDLGVLGERNAGLGLFSKNLRNLRNLWMSPPAAGFLSRHSRIS